MRYLSLAARCLAATAVGLATPALHLPATAQEAASAAEAKPADA
ncbi:MAG: hypothetical protein RLY70_3936, partial [Planctomycetota bacterium]